MRIAIVNGPNLNLLGRREPGIYGTETFADYLESLKTKFPELEFEYFQSNVEGEIISALQNLSQRVSGIVLNAAAYTHTSIGIADAVKAIGVPVIEVHISNVYAREPYRHQSFLSPVAAGIIAGLGLDGYELGVRALLLKTPGKTGAN